MIYKHRNEMAGMVVNTYTYLVNKLTAVNVVGNENLRPQLWLTSPDKVPCLLLEHGVFIGDRDQLVIAKTLCICNIREIWISSLAEFSDDQRLVELGNIDK